jgi:hypothetical protein
MIFLSPFGELDLTENLGNCIKPLPWQRLSKFNIGLVYLGSLKCDLKLRNINCEVYLLTYGAEPFLRSCQLCSPSRTPQHFTVSNRILNMTRLFIRIKFVLYVTDFLPGDRLASRRGRYSS